jgi:hypothetical protein
MRKSDFTCDLQCPFKAPTGAWCCKGCPAERKGHVSKKTKKYWTKKNGFWGKNGCKLPRALMPPDCRTYNCKAYGFDVWHFQHVVIRWKDGWKRDGKVTIEDGVGNMKASAFAPYFRGEKQNVKQ